MIARFYKERNELMDARNAKIAQQRVQLRASLWPDVTEEMLWHRRKKQGFVTIPRTMPLIINIIDSLTPKGKPVGSTYLDLWCRAFDEMIVNLDKPREMAFAAGFSGQRGTQTWAGRIDILSRLGFLRLAAGSNGPRSYALILNPYIVIKGRRTKIDKSLYNVLAERAAIVKADDLSDQAPLPTVLPPPAPAAAA